MMHIGLCADENFALPFGVCLTSIFESHNGEPLTVHVITQGFSEKTIERVHKAEAKYNCLGAVKIYNIDDDIFSQYPLSEQFPKSIYFRYLYARILPGNIDRIIYIDCDTVVLSSLKEMWETEMGDEVLLGAVEDRNGDDILIRNRIRRWNGLYFNSGVLLMNLTAWRESDAFKTFADFIRDNREICLYPDQDAINTAFADKFVRLPFQFNYHMSFVASFDTFRLHLSKKDELERAFSKIAILHYAAEIKPWYKDSRHPLIFIWLHFYRNSEWSDVKLKFRRPIIHRIMKAVILYVFYRNNKKSVNPALKDALRKYEQQYSA